MEIEIDENYNDAKIFKNFKRVPFLITQLPEAKDKEFLAKHIGYYGLFSERLIKESVPSDKASHKIDTHIYLAVTLFFGVLGPLIFTIEEGGLLPLGIYLFFIVLGAFFGKITYNYWKKYQETGDYCFMLLDRVNTLITLPKIGDKEYLKIPFSHLRVSIHAIGGSATTYSGEKLWFYRDYSSNIVKRHNAYISRGGFYPSTPQQDWSFYVWYMDKNRPLPPGTAFDEFREKDFERRKSEGFPKPLFESDLETPEATSEQQAERERIARW